MPQASTGEFLDKLHDLINDYIERVSVAEMIGALECKKLEVYCHTHDITPRGDEGGEGEEWKRGSDS